MKFYVTAHMPHSRCTRSRAYVRVYARIAAVVRTS